MELFQTLPRMRAGGLKVTEMVKELGLNGRRLSRWLRLDVLPERNRMQPRPGMPEAFREYLRQRWEPGCRDAIVAARSHARVRDTSVASEESGVRRGSSPL
jgi:transposase